MEGGGWKMEDGELRKEDRGAWGIDAVGAAI
jgi:hypothetical protein